MKPLQELISGQGFDRYQDGLRSRFRAYRFGYAYRYTGPDDDPALEIEFTTSLHRGQVVAHESGVCDLEAWDAATGERVLFEYRELRDESEFHDALMRVVLFMRDATGWPLATGGEIAR